MNFNQPLDEKLFIAEGSSKRVYVDPTSPERVIGSYKERRLEENVEYAVKARYYGQKILHELFPENFADIYYSTALPDRIGLERIHPEPVYFEFLPIWREYSRFRESESSPAEIVRHQELSKQVEHYWKEVLLARGYKRLVEDIEKTGVIIDTYSMENFAPVEGGKLVYVDTVDWPFGIVAFHKEKLREYIAGITDTEKRKRLEKRFSRLVDLRDRLATLSARDFSSA